MLRFGHAGDTIVEVMLAIAVAGFALAGAYASVNHSLLDVRDAQEHEEALSLAESQAEVLNSQTTSQLTADAGLGSFCFDLTHNPPVTAAASAGACQNIGNEQFAVTINGIAPPSAPNLYSFQITIKWTGLNGNQDITQLAYQPLGGN